MHHAAPVFGEVVRGGGTRSQDAFEAVEAAAVASEADAVSVIRMAASAGWGLRMPEEDAPTLHVPEGAHRFADAFLRERGIEASAPLALSPIASSELKRWPIERLARVADELLEDSGDPLLLFCGPRWRSPRPWRARCSVRPDFRRPHGPAGEPVLRGGLLHRHPGATPVYEGSTPRSL